MGILSDTINILNSPEYITLGCLSKKDGIHKSNRGKTVQRISPDGEIETIGVLGDVRSSDKFVTATILDFNGKKKMEIGVRVGQHDRKETGKGLFRLSYPIAVQTISGKTIHLIKSPTS